MALPSSTTAVDVTFDVSEALPFGQERNTLAATVHVPVERVRATRSPVVLVCWPGGSYSRAYYDMHIEGHPGYSFADHLSALGFIVVRADPLGVGDSSRPAEGDAVNLEVMAAAAAELVRQVRHRLQAGSLSAELEPVDRATVVGVGHSMGGCLAVVEQARSRSYDALCVLGFTHGEKARAVGPAQGGEGPEAARQAAIEQAKAIFGATWDDVYSGGDRTNQHAWLHGADVPAEVVSADDALAVRWPRMSYVEALTAGLTANYAAMIEVPTLVAFGDQDIPEHPREDVAFYSGCDDVTLVVLPRSAHCHNFAGTRHMLWDRLAIWSRCIAEWRDLRSASDPARSERS